MTASDTLPGLRALCATIDTTYHMRMRGRCNSDRQMEGGFLLTLMEIVTGVDEKEDALSDVLCQLMHRASDPDDPLDFDRALEGARRNFVIERSEEGDLEPIAERCPECGAEEPFAWEQNTYWNAETQQYDIGGDVLADPTCSSCGYEGNPDKVTTTLDPLT